jgi:hypothetical protein
MKPYRYHINFGPYGTQIRKASTSYRLWNALCNVFIHCTNIGGYWIEKIFLTNLRVNEESSLLANILKVPVSQSQVIVKRLNHHE